MDEEIQSEEDTQKDKYLTFTLEDELYGIDISVVIEIIGILPITAVPEVPPYVKGIINLRGKIIPVVNMRLRFRRTPREYTDRTCVIVIEADGVLVGLIIDGVSEVRDIPESEVVPPPKLKAAQNRYIKGVGRQQDGKVVLLLDWQKLFSSEEAELFEAMADDGAEDEAAPAESAGNGMG